MSKKIKNKQQKPRGKRRLMKKSLDELMEEYIAYNSLISSDVKQKKRDIKITWLEKRARSLNPPVPILMRSGLVKRKTIINPMLEKAFIHDFYTITRRNDENLAKKLLEFKKWETYGKMFKDRVISHDIANASKYKAIGTVMNGEYKQGDYIKLHQTAHKMGQPMKGQHAYRISRASNPNLKNKPSPLRNVSTKSGGRKTERRTSITGRRISRTGKRTSITRRKKNQQKDKRQSL
jgi:hypothetical protein